MNKNQLEYMESKRMKPNCNAFSTFKASAIASIHYGYSVIWGHERTTYFVINGRVVSGIEGMNQPTLIKDET